MVRAHFGAGRGLRRIGLEPGDHLVTALQNNWQAATMHWACQFAGIIVTPLNWRPTADELDYCVANADAKALVYEEPSAHAVRSSKQAQACPRIVVGRRMPAISPSKRWWRALPPTPSRGSPPMPGR